MPVESLGHACEQLDPGDPKNSVDSVELGWEGSEGTRGDQNPTPGDCFVSGMHPKVLRVPESHPFP